MKWAEDEQPVPDKVFLRMMAPFIIAWVAGLIWMVVR
jgi:hypothetical protein